MKGLLRKEFYMVKPFWWVFLIVMILYAIVDQTDFGTGYLFSLAALLLYTPRFFISYRDYEWESYLCTMPVSRKMIVQSKYILCILYGVSLWIPGSLCYLIMGASWQEALCSPGCIVMLMVLVNTTDMFVYLRSQSASSILFTSFAMPIAVTLLWKRYLESEIFFHMIMLFVVAVIAVLYPLTYRLYEKEEF